MKYKWIDESGICELADIYSLLKKINIKKSWFIAMMTDSFVAASFEEDKIPEIAKEELLELRVFNEDSELLVTRGCIGADFSWRITDDTKLSEEDYIISKQYIDINTNIPAEVLGDGNRALTTTGGGRYSLPITETQNRIQVMSYVSYDKNGMAKIVDSRACCFTE